MPKVYFWNAQHLAQDSAAIRDASQRALERAEAAAKKHAELAVESGNAATRAVTRSQTRSLPPGSGQGYKKLRSPRSHQRYNPIGRAPPEDRISRGEVRAQIEVIKRTDAADVRRKKCATVRWLNNTGLPVFYCEVQEGFGGRTSSLRDSVAVGAHTLCYSTNIRGALSEPRGFPASGEGIVGPPGRGHLQNGTDRIPKCVGYEGVNLFFWHAPSGNSGAVVVAVWRFIQHQYPRERNILFGDLNSEPGTLTGQGLALGDLAEPKGPTHCSGDGRGAKMLDYALANFPGVKVEHAKQQGMPPGGIKGYFGSDHTPMVLSWP